MRTRGPRFYVVPSANGTFTVNDQCSRFIRVNDDGTEEPSSAVGFGYTREGAQAECDRHNERCAAQDKRMEALS